MANAVKNAILRKKVNGVMADLMAKTSAEMVYINDTETLLTRLGTISTAIEDAKTKLNTLQGPESTTGSVLASIKTAIDRITNTAENGSLDLKIAAIQEALDEINGEDGDGILDQAKSYTDTQIGGITGQTVKQYVDAIDTALKASIAGALHFKGVVDYKEDLSTKETNAAEGDVYQVKYRGAKSAEGTDPWNAEFVWVKNAGTSAGSWEELGSIVDLSNYYTKTQVDEKISYLSQGSETAVANALKDAKEYTDSRLGSIGGSSATVESFVSGKLGTITNGTVAADIAAAEAAANSYTDDQIGTLTEDDVASEIAAAKQAAISAGSQAAANAQSAAQQFTTTELAKKGRVVVSETDVAPQDIADGDLWIYVMGTSTNLGVSGSGE